MLHFHKVKTIQHRIAPVPVYPKLPEASVVVQCKICPLRLVGELGPQHFTAVLRPELLTLPAAHTTIRERTTSLYHRQQ